MRVVKLSSTVNNNVVPRLTNQIDEFSVFPKQWKKRSAYYKKEKWKFDETEMLDNQVINNDYEEQEPITDCVL